MYLLVFLSVREREIERGRKKAEARTKEEPDRLSFRGEKKTLKEYAVWGKQNIIVGKIIILGLTIAKNKKSER